ncbi:MAG: hypothetical protein WB799_01510 [Candidatus Sulfotelmatobacter sp.]
MKYSLALVLLGTLAFSQLAIAQQIGSLDLTTATKKDRLREPKGVGSGSCGWVDHADYPEVAISLTSLDRTQYALGEDVMFEVKIQNVGKDPVVLPWAEDVADFEPQDPTAQYSYRTGTLSLQIGNGKENFLIFSSFYGSTERPESLKVLRAGEWVIVRSRTQLVTNDDWVFRRFRNNPLVNAQVKPGLMLNKATFQPKGRDGKPTESSCINVRTRSMNQLPVTIFPPLNSH